MLRWVQRLALDFGVVDWTEKSFRFQIGSGAGTLDLEFFSGAIELRKLAP
ncbi:MAG: hypothetical protein AAF604_01780 [Acidobacteriota bacterium]